MNQLDWFQARAETFEYKNRRIGPDFADEKAVRILNRVVSWDESGIEYEADQRHAELIIKHLSGSKSVVTLGEKKAFEVRESVADLTRESAGVYRAIVARGNFFAQARSDIQFTINQLARRMSCSKECDWDSAERLERYLIG